MPYRTNASEIEVTTESSEVKRWKAIHDRYANLQQQLWRLPDGEPNPMNILFEHEETDVVCAVSADGERVVVVGGGRAWRVDREPLSCEPLGAWPDVEALVLDDTGATAAYIADRKVFVRDLATKAPRHLRLTDRPRRLSLSADGQTLVVTDDRRVFVFDTRIDELVYAFEPRFKVRDEWRPCIHPSGRLLLIYGEGTTTVYGREGLRREMSQGEAGCFARSGELLALGTSKKTDIYRVGDDLADWQMLPDFSFDEGLPVSFSPDGRLLQTTNKVIDLEPTRLHYQHQVHCKATTSARAGSGAGFFGERLVVPLQASVRTPSGEHRCGAAVFSLEDGSRLGGISVTSADGQSRLLGFTRGGLFGCLAGDRLIDNPATPFERPGIIASVLFDSEQTLSAEDSLLHYEHVERDAYCRDIASRLLPGVDYRELMPLLRGLLHLTPEIIRRAQELSGSFVRFGPAQVTLVGIRRACDELRALSDFEQMQRFERMLGDLGQRSVAKRPPAITPASDEDIPSMRVHRRMKLEQLLFADDD